MQRENDQDSLKKINVSSTCMFSQVELLGLESYRYSSFKRCPDLV